MPRERGSRRRNARGDTRPLGPRPRLHVGMEEVLEVAAAALSTLERDRCADNCDADSFVPLTFRP